MRLTTSIVEAASMRAHSALTVALTTGAAILVLYFAGQSYADRELQRVQVDLANARKTAAQIVLLDERLTMSAQAAAATGDAVWIERYIANLPAMEKALSLAQSMTSAADSRLYERHSRDANAKLVIIEQLSIAAAKSRNLRKAQKLLVSDEYVKLKHKRAQATNRFLGAVVKSGEAKLAATKFVGTAISSGMSLLLFVGAMLLRWYLLKNFKASEDAYNDAEAEIVEHSRNAELASKAKSQFLANMSHEIRTPLNGVIGMIGVLMETSLSNEQRQHAEMARQSGEMLLALVNDILDFSKIEAGKIELECTAFNLVRIVEAATGMMGEKAHSKGVEILSFVAPEISTSVRGDSLRIQQVLTNFVSNAVKFTERGEVTITARPLASQTGSWVRFEVADTGIGIPLDVQSRLFQEFNQSDASTARHYGGTGLGLAISAKLITLMGGRFGVESEPGQGSLFWFELPLAVGATQNIQDAALKKIEGARVLVATANERSRKLYHEFITSWRLRNGCVSNGQDAMQRLMKAAQESDPYSIILLDLESSNGGGIETLRQIKSNPATAATKVVMLAASTRSVKCDEALAAGAEACLAKPVRQSQLFDCMAQLIVSGSFGADSEQVTHAKNGAVIRHQGRILIAEDNAVNQRVAASVLETLGYRCDVVSNGLEAVDAVRKLPYDAILMDCRMPELDGFAATSEIRRWEDGARRIPIIALTADVVEDAKQKCLQAGMDDFISKPLRREQLSAVLQRWVTRPAVEIRVESLPEMGPSQFLDVPQFTSIASLPTAKDANGENSIFRLFLIDAAQRIDAFSLLLAAGDHEEIARSAHGLRGSAGNIGAVAMQELAGRIESLAQAGQLSEIPPLVEQLKVQFGRVRGAIHAHTPDKVNQMRVQVLSA